MTDHHSIMIIDLENLRFPSLLVSPIITTLSIFGQIVGTIESQMTISLKVVSRKRRRKLLQHAQRVLARNHLGLCFFAVKCHKITVKSR